MANILVATGTVEGHMYPSLQVVKELVKRGHKIIYWTGESSKLAVEIIGAKHYPIPEYWDSKDIPYYEFRPEVAELKGIKQIKFYIKTEFLGYAQETLDFYDEIKDDFKIDLILIDPITWPVYFLATKLKVPCVNIHMIPLLTSSKDTAPFGTGLLPATNIVTTWRNRLLTYITNEWLLKDTLQFANKKRELFGLSHFDKRHKFIANAMLAIPDRILYMTVPSFEYPRTDNPNTIEYIGPVIRAPEPDFVEPEWWPELQGDKAIILVNQGTMISDLSDLILPTIDALRDDDYLVIAVPVTRELTGLPDNVRTSSFIPFGNILPYVDVFVTNAGYGGVHMALAEGIPIVAAGEQDDKMEIAARIEWSGCGINLRSKSPKPKKIRQAITEVLSDPAYQKNAERLQNEIKRYDPVTLACDAVDEELAKLQRQEKRSSLPQVDSCDNNLFLNRWSPYQCHLVMELKSAIGAT